MKDEGSDTGCAKFWEVSTDQCIPERSYNSSGACGNASSRLRNMTLRRSDPLSELVWSSDKGVCVKYTDISSLADKNQILLRKFQSVGSEGSKDKIIADEEDSTKLQMVLNIESNHHRMEEEAGTGENEDLCTLQYVQNTDIAETRKENEPHEALICPSLHLSYEDVNNYETKFHVVSEEAHKLDLAHLSQEKYLSLKRSLTLFQEKGKEKEVSKEKSSNDTNESVESCNGGTSLYLKGTKREICTQEQISGSKRMKNQIQGSYSTVSPSGHDSSFMSWISNMVKGLSDSNKEEEPSSLAPAVTHEKTGDSGNLSTGFQTMFQSLYGQNTKKRPDKMSLKSLPRCHNEKVDVSPFNTSPSIPQSTSKIAKISSPLPSLWITRLYSQATNTEKGDRIAIEKVNHSNMAPDVVKVKTYKPSAGLKSFSLPSSETTPHDQNFQLCRVLPAEMVHEVRKLRLSRNDILRWMISDVSLSHLNGFFVRLRLGTVETGQYYVACILGDSREHNDCKSEKSLWVDIGGIKSSVATRYISNNDFLEDEIDVWWSRIVRNGGNIPSLDMLKLKYKEKKALGY